MKKKNIIIGGFSLVAVVLAAGLISSTSAQAGTNEFKAEKRQNRSFMMEGNNLSEEQKLEMQSKRAERQEEARLHREKMELALNSGSYETWSAMVSETMGSDSFLLEKVSAENFEEFAERHKTRQVNGEAMNQGRSFAKNRLEKMGRGPGSHQGNCPIAQDLE